jgi:hypothetical protein
MSESAGAFERDTSAGHGDVLSPGTLETAVRAQNVTGVCNKPRDPLRRPEQPRAQRMEWLGVRDDFPNWIVGAP